MSGGGPSLKTLKVLFAQSRNRCAAPDCENPIIADATQFDKAAVLGKVAHIVARSADGPRGNPDFPRDQLHDESNLILLCGHHHSLVDAQAATYTVDELRHWKATHLVVGPTAESLIEQAKQLARSQRHDDAVVLFEQAVDRAAETDDECRRIAHIGAARCLLRAAGDASTKPTTIVARIERHLDDARTSGAAAVQVLATQAWLAERQGNPELMLERATAAYESADATLADRADALNAQLCALTELGNIASAVVLSDGAARDVAEKCPVGDAWMQLSLARLGVLAHAEHATLTDTARQFADEITGGGSESATRLNALQCAAGLSEAASMLARAGSLPDALELGVSACEIAATQPDLELTISVSLQTVELATINDDEKQARHIFRLWDELLIPQAHAQGVKDIESVYRLQTGFARGSCLIRLAHSSGRSSTSAKELLTEAADTLEATAAMADADGDALARQGGSPAILRADIAYWQGQAASGLGNSLEAAQWFHEARSGAARTSPHFWRERGLVAWVNEAKALRTGGRLMSARAVLRDAVTAVQSACEADQSDEGLGRLKAHATGFLAHVEQFEAPVFEWLESAAARDIGDNRATLREGVAAQVAPLIDWWQGWACMAGDTEGSPFAEFLDFWGRGGLCRVAAAVRGQAHRAVAVDATSIPDVRRWARILCPLFDTVIVKWKGSLNDGIVKCPIDADYGGPGGHGYDLVNEFIAEIGSDPPVPRWGMTISSACLMPQELATFLAHEAITLVQAGRLVVVPAPLVGCTQSKVGWTDDLFVDGLLGGAVSVVGSGEGEHDGSSARRVFDLGSSVIPYIEGVTMTDLARVLEDANDWLSPLRAVILKGVADEELRHERWERLTLLQDDITDACRELDGRYRKVVRDKPDAGWRVDTVDSSVVATERPDAPHESQAQPDPITTVLQSIGTASRDPAPWIPYWLLKGVGGQLRWSGPLDNKPVERAPRERPRLPISSWLHPGTAGFGVRPAVTI